MKTNFCVLIFLLAVVLTQAQTNSLTALLQQGLFEEQANQNLDAAISNYQSLAVQFDKDRQLAATAVFRIGECYRMQGKTNEAAAQYQRILREFPDQTMLVTLSGQDLTGLGATASEAAPSENSGAELWDKVKNLSPSELEKILPTLAPDAVLTSLLQQRNEVEAKLAELRVEFSEVHPDVKKQKAVLDAINKQISEKIDGIMHALKLRFEISRPTISTSAVSSNDETTDEEDQEIQRIQQMIKDSPDLINARGDDGSTPLTKAAYNGWLKVATYLLDHGADVNAGGIAVLNSAATAGNRAMVELLLSRGANVNEKDPLGKTPLLVAVEKEYPSVIEVLLANHADVNALSAGEATPLCFAATKGKLKIVQMLLDAGANPNVKDFDGRTPLNYAITVSPPEIFQALLKAGTDANTQDSQGRTPLSYAAERDGRPMIVKTLLDSQADPNGGKLDAPLLCAIHGKNTASAELLLQAGANPNLNGATDWPINFGGYSYPSYLQGRTITPLFLAVSMNQLPMVQLLLKFKADPNDSQTDRRSVLFDALSDTNILEALLDAGAKVDPISADETQWTPLGAAANQNNASAVEILLKHGANPNVHNRNGATPLHWAAYQLADSNIFELLLANKADPNVRSSNGKTPLDELKERMKQNSTSEQLTLASQLADLLRQHGALDNLPNWDCITVSRPSSNFSMTIFQKGTNDWNQFTLLEAILNLYRYYSPRSYPSPSALFPDLARVVIVRPNHSSTNEMRIEVNLLDNTNGVDCSKDMPLEFGDVVEIPERDHALGDNPIGLTESQRDTIGNYLKGSVQLVAHGQKVELPIYPFADGSLIGSVFQQPEATKVLLSSSDLSRVKVIRRDVKTGKKHEWIVDCSNAVDLWLRDGDVIEVPEKP